VTACGVARPASTRACRCAGLSRLSPPSTAWSWAWSVPACFLGCRPASTPPQRGCRSLPGGVSALSRLPTLSGFSTMRARQGSNLHGTAFAGPPAVSWRVCQSSPLTRWVRGLLTAGIPDFRLSWELGRFFQLLLLASGVATRVRLTLRNGQGIRASQSRSSGLSSYWALSLTLPRRTGRDPLTRVVRALRPRGADIPRERPARHWPVRAAEVFCSEGVTASRRTRKRDGPRPLRTLWRRAESESRAGSQTHRWPLS